MASFEKEVPLFLNLNFSLERASSDEVDKYLDELSFLYDSLVSYMDATKLELDSAANIHAHIARCSNYINRIEEERRRILSYER